MKSTSLSHALHLQNVSCFFPLVHLVFFLKQVLKTILAGYIITFFIHLLVICEPDIVHGGGTALEVLVVLAQVVLQSVVGHNFLTQPTPPYGYSKVELNLIKYSRKIIFDISNGRRE